MEITAEVESGIKLTITRKFDMYRRLVTGVAEGKLRHIIVRGSPGIGKSFVADEIMTAFATTSAESAENADEKRIRYNRASGHTTPLAFYNSLYEFRNKGDISVFDDCDAVFCNGQSLNILKAATDTRADRTISWHTSSSLAAVPSYKYEGSIIILTNLNMRHPCYSAILDRVFYYDMALSPEEKIVRIKWIAESEYVADEISVGLAVNWLLHNYSRLESQLSVRTFIKLIELIQFDPCWKDLAELLFFEH